jgi:hypothetical protein
MKQLRAAELTNYAPFDRRGVRKPGDVLAGTSRDYLLRLAAERFFAGASDRQAAEMLHAKLTRYAAGAWRRDRSEERCPDRHRGRIEALLREILQTRDAVPSSRSIRRALGFTWPN